MEEKKLVPKLRFPGFTEPWEQRKLGDYLVVSYLKNFEGKYDKEDVLSVSGDYGIVNQIDFQGRSFAGKSVLNYGIVGMGDIVYTKSPLKKNPFGIIKTNKLNSGIVSTLYAIYTPKKNCNAIFVEQYFELDSRLNEYLKPLVNKGAKNDMKVSSEKALDGNIIFPAIEEQKRISAFLEFFGRYITLHQRKLEHLKLKKKSLLQKLFPKEGEVYPELRFPGFTDPWEQRKLEGLCDLFTDGDWIESKDQCGSGVRLIQTGNIGVTEYLDKPDNKKWVSDETFGLLHCKEVFPGDILISRLPEPAGRACIVPHLGTKMITAVDCTIVRTSTNTNASFLVQYLSSQPYFNEVNKCLAGGTRQRISRSNLAEFKVLVPSEKAEQDIIGKLFDKFDNLITLHQRKLEHLQLLKKALLQQLFV